MTEPAAPMGAHYCTGCGQMHGGEHQAAEVEIARIEADRAIRVAEIERGMARHETDMAAATEVEVAEIAAAAGIEETASLAGAVAESGEPPEPPAVIVDAPPDAEPEVRASIEPRDDSNSPEPPAAKKSSLSYWP